MGAGEGGCRSSSREQISSSAFWLCGTLRGLDGTHPHWVGPSASFSSPIQMLASSGNTLLDTPRKNVLSAIWASPSPVKLTYKIHHHCMLCICSTLVNTSKYICKVYVPIYTPTGSVCEFQLLQILTNIFSFSF